MTQTAIICLAIVLALLGISMLGFLPGFIVAIALFIEAVLILAGSRLTS